MNDLNSSSSDQTDQSRRGKARERQRRRRERGGQPMVAAPKPTRPRSRSQLQPAGGFEMPKVNLGYLRPVAVVVSGAIFMLAVIFFVGMFKNDPVEADPNAIWIGDTWTYQQHEDDVVRRFVDRLQEHRIGSVYAYVSELNHDGTWTGRVDEDNLFAEVQEDVTAFAQQFKRLYPQVQLYGTVGIRADLGEEGYRLDDETLHQAVADFSVQVVNRLGFDGVLLNVEPVWDADENFLRLLRRVRQAIGEEALLAVAVPPDWTPVDEDVPIPSLIAEGTVWDRQYKQRVGLIQIDQIVIRSYNSYLTNADDYVAWMAYQVKTFAEAVGALQTSTRLLVGIPTYRTALPAHDVRVENVNTALAGLLRGLEEAGENAGMVQGAAIFAEWDTEDAEWAQFKNGWIGR